MIVEGLIALTPCHKRLKGQVLQANDTIHVSKILDFKVMEIQVKQAKQLFLVFYFLY